MGPNCFTKAKRTKMKHRHTVRVQMTHGKFWSPSILIFPALLDPLAVKPLTNFPSPREEGVPARDVDA